MRHVTSNPGPCESTVPDPEGPCRYELGCPVRNDSTREAKGAGSWKRNPRRFPVPSPVGSCTRSARSPAAPRPGPRRILAATPAGPSPGRADTGACPSLPTTVAMDYPRSRFETTGWGARSPGCRKPPRSIWSSQGFGPPVTRDRLHAVRQVRTLAAAEGASTVMTGADGGEGPGAEPRVP